MSACAPKKRDQSLTSRMLRTAWDEALEDSGEDTNHGHPRICLEEQPRAAPRSVDREDVC
jgi:hypothetical protein